MKFTKEQIGKVFKKNGTDKFHLHHYEFMYSYVFNRMTNIDKLLEIGVQRGRSIRAWLELLPETQIVGVDIVIKDIVPNIDRALLLQADSRHPSVKQIVGDDYDIIIDDGAHSLAANWETFQNLQGSWSQYYVIEDIYGEEKVNKLYDKISSLGYKHIDIFHSAEFKAQIKKDGKNWTFPFLAMVIKAM